MVQYRPVPNKENGSSDPTEKRINEVFINRRHESGSMTGSHNEWVDLLKKNGAPGVIRTPGTRFRKPLLYPPELQGRL